MYEVEVKIAADHDRVLGKIQELSDGDNVRAFRLWELDEEDTYYDTPDKELAANNEVLRLRKKHDETASSELGYKGPNERTTSNARKEVETRIEHEESMKNVLESLGYVKQDVVEKHRARYRVEDCLVMVDTVEGLGDFVEVEHHPDTMYDEAESVDEAEQSVFDVAKLLGLDPTDSISSSYRELLQGT